MKKLVKKSIMLALILFIGFVSVNFSTMESATTESWSYEGRYPEFGSPYLWISMGGSGSTADVIAVLSSFDNSLFAINYEYYKNGVLQATHHKTFGDENHWGDSYTFTNVSSGDYLLVTARLGTFSVGYTVP